MYPAFSVPGVKSEDIWQLFNVSNYAYYLNKVRDLRAGVCPFCTIDPHINEVLQENDSWRLWKNTMAPRSGQECQLIVPSKRHTEHITSLSEKEWRELGEMIDWAHLSLGLGAHGVWVIRTGDPARNAKSVPHLHFNFHYPTGVDRVEVTIAKSEVDLAKKLPILIAFEKLRIAEERGDENPSSVLTEDEWGLIVDKMGAPPSVK